MSTSNFYKKNAKYYYAIMPQVNEAEDENIIADTDWWDNKIAYIQEALSKSFGDKFDKEYWSGWVDNNTRLIGIVKIPFHYLKMNMWLYMSVLLRSGYYEGANLDYSWEWYIENECFEIDSASTYELNGDNLVKEIEDWFISDNWTCLNMGIFNIHRHRLARKLNKILGDTADKLEAVFKKVSVPMGVVARFSNGETIYKAVE